MKKVFFALILLVTISGNSIQFLKNEGIQKSFEKLVSEIDNNSLENQLSQYTQLSGESLERNFLYDFFYDFFNQTFNEYLSDDFISSISDSLTDIYLQNPNNFIRKKYFATEIVKQLIIEIEMGKGAPSFNSFCIFLMQLFGMDEDYCE